MSDVYLRVHRLQTYNYHYGGRPMGSADLASLLRHSRVHILFPWMSPMSQILSQALSRVTSL